MDVSTEVRPHVLMWTQPRAAFRRVLASHTRDWSWVLLAIGTWTVQAFVRSESRAGALFPGIAVVGLALASGIVFGPLLVFLMSGALYVAGRIAGGPATFREIRAAYAWAWLPNAVMVVGWLPATLIFGRTLYAATAGIAQAGGPVSLVAALLALILNIACFVAVGWSLVLTVIGVAEAERTTVASAFFQVLGAFIAMGVLIAFVVMGVILALARPH